MDQPKIRCAVSDLSKQWSTDATRSNGETGNSLLYVTQGMDQWQAVVNKAMNFRVS